MRAGPTSESFQGLVLEGVTRRFGGVEAVRDVSFSVGAGEIVGLIGPNGAGKSTLLSLISGNQKPSAGTISFKGHRLDRMPAHAVARLGVGRAHQIPRPFRRMTVLDNARVAAHSGSGRRVVEHDAHVREVLEVCGLADKSHRLAGALTLLDLKRLEVARVLALQPSLVLLDEVAAGLVGPEIDAVADLIRLVNARGTSVLMVEHVQSLIQVLARRVIVLDWGRKIAEGPPAEVARDPAVVAVYMGTAAAPLARLAAEELTGQPNSAEAPEPATRAARPSGHVADGMSEVGVRTGRANGQEPLLVAEGVSVNYGLLRALREVDFQLAAGEVVAVLGANGAGKTTLASALAGTVPLASGRVLLEGQDISRQPAHIRARKGIALCHEGRRLFNELSVRENLELATRASFQRAFDLFPELKQKEKELAGRLSGGQQQMVAIARAMVAEPRVVIFDELSLGLAPLVIDRIYDTLEQVRAWGIGVVLIEQNVHRALAQADRVYVMERGHVSFTGTPAELSRADMLHEAYFGGGSAAIQHSRETTHA